MADNPSRPTTERMANDSASTANFQRLNSILAKRVGAYRVIEAQPVNTTSKTNNVAAEPPKDKK
jgi:hypothetical protein